MDVPHNLSLNEAASKHAMFGPLGSAANHECDEVGPRSGGRRGAGSNRVGKRDGNADRQAMEPRCDRLKERVDGGNIPGQRMAGVVLNPLAKVCIGVLMPVMIGRRQVMVNGERGRKRSDHQQQ